MNNDVLEQHGSGKTSAVGKGSKGQGACAAQPASQPAGQQASRARYSAGLSEVCAVGWREIWALQVSGRWTQEGEENKFDLAYGCRCA